MTLTLALPKLHPMRLATTAQCTYSALLANTCATTRSYGPLYCIQTMRDCRICILSHVLLLTLNAAAPFGIVSGTHEICIGSGDDMVT